VTTARESGAPTVGTTHDVGSVAPGAWLVALDIDGTLLSHDGFLSAEARGAVADVRGAGHEVVLATGRSLVGVLPVLVDLGITTSWVVASNGAVTARVDPAIDGGYEIVDLVTFDPEPALRAVRAELPEAHIAVEKVGVGSLVTSPFPDGELTGEQLVMDFEELCALPATRVVVRSPAHTSEHFTELAHRLALTEVSYFVGWTAWLDIVPPGVTKASALERLRGVLGADPDRTLAVGDGSNDVAMLAWAARGVAMGHAAAAVVAAADELTLPIADDGVVPVLRSLLEG